MSEDRAARLAAIKERVAAATPGIWYYTRDTGGMVTTAATTGIAQTFNRFQEDFYNDEANGIFIAHSREDVEWLLDELGRTRAALAGLLGDVTTEQAAGCREVIHSERAWQEGVTAMLGKPRESEVSIEGGEGL